MVDVRELIQFLSSQKIAMICPAKFLNVDDYLKNCWL